MSIREQVFQMAQEFGRCVYFHKDVVGGCEAREKKIRQIHVVMGAWNTPNGQGNYTFKVITKTSVMWNIDVVKFFREINPQTP